mmetsp:Transcript_3572/g.5431  ORF Transcript_3572/g.5431 Transcript_3572/m.5431 type:complete len:442 (+) Transcript_3572:294-1619(+)|eukprot:CAMPEP_0184648568 /NCGR_PEP_ID=MMETSP0308-20130426/5718_1 /TAXON_ID=38269 /ORGANISM="Gloeochaete witrockiana, Strain SAG 46.84" /LENGTH=441 /DNA_ID=CAMNT_0027080509 /DNA_START=254 /DNA_END=1576 /DNA_ORIENTATION=-
MPGSRVLQRLTLRECGIRRLNASPPHERVLWENVVPTQIPNTFREREIRLVLKPELDKIFDATWLDEQTVVCGTKDNKLLQVNTVTQRYNSIPLISYEGERRTSPYENCGIHTITLNPSGDRLVCGSDQPQDIAVYDVPSFKPVALLHGHTDWVFGSAWIDDATLLTSSRDGTVKAWRLGEKQLQGRESSAPRLDEATNAYRNVPHFTCFVSKAEHKGKVRAIKNNKRSREFGTISNDETFKLWDSQRLTPIQTLHMTVTLADLQAYSLQEAVCMAVSEDYNLFAVGSRSHLSLVDPRMETLADQFTCFQSKDKDNQGLGVRSLSFYHHVITVGGGGGDLSFFDMRKNNMDDKFPLDTSTMDFFNVLDPNTGKYAPEIVTGRGRKYDIHPLFRQPRFGEPDMHFECPHAVYAHAYSPGGTRLLTAGGPLAYGFRGCYLAVW